MPHIKGRPTAVTQDSKQSIEPRFVFFMVMKKESGPHWPRLTKDKNQYKGFIRTDWTRFIVRYAMCQVTNHSLDALR